MHGIFVDGCSLLRDSGSVPLPEEKWLEETPHIHITPVLAQDICWVDATWNVVESNKLGSYSLTYTVERQCSVSFVKFGMDLTSTLNHRLVVPK